jgi:hypothetical protein
MAKNKEESASSGVKVIIEKYLQDRDDLMPSIRTMLCVIYRGQTKTADEWKTTIEKRLTRQAI